MLRAIITKSSDSCENLPDWVELARPEVPNRGLFCPQKTPSNVRRHLWNFVTLGGGGVGMLQATTRQRAAPSPVKKLVPKANSTEVEKAWVWVDGWTHVSSLVQSELP